jgi:hypothetical protein
MHSARSHNRSVIWRAVVSHSAAGREDDSLGTENYAAGDGQLSRHLCRHRTGRRAYAFPYLDVKSLVWYCQNFEDAGLQSDLMRRKT